MKRPFALTVATHVLLTLAAILTLYPVLWVVKMALSPSQGASPYMGAPAVPTITWWMSLAGLPSPSSTRM